MIPEKERERERELGEDSVCYYIAWCIVFLMFFGKRHVPWKNKIVHDTHTHTHISRLSISHYTVGTSDRFSASCMCFELTVVHG